VIRQLARTVRRAASRLVTPGGRAVILLYHRIADGEADPYGLCVSPEHFAEHLQVMRDVGRPMSLRELARGLREGTLADRAVCVTFDDAYADNLYVAKPVLERHGVPATVFATTGPAGRAREFWWDELERAFLSARRVEDRLELDIGGRPRTWDLGGDGRNGGGRAAQAAPNAGWHLLDEPAPSPRHAAFREVYDLLQPLEPEARSAALDRLLSWAGLDPSDVRPSRRALEPRELVDLARGELVEIGAHTVTHSVLPLQPREVQREEVARSKADVEAWLGGTAAVDGFTYPYGRYDESSVAAAQAAGFAYACSGDYQPVFRSSNLYLLPRVEVRDMDGDTLAERIRWALAVT
jgi:peptidoglycan/xylan/chitin deacetylase (PgdA/CDA1 family)